MHPPRRFEQLSALCSGEAGAGDGEGMGSAQCEQSVACGIDRSLDAHAANLVMFFSQRRTVELCPATVEGGYPSV
jgi:hypothetical protein